MNKKKEDEPISTLFFCLFFLSWKTNEQISTNHSASLSASIPRYKHPIKSLRFHSDHQMQEGPGYASWGGEEDERGQERVVGVERWR